MNKEILDSLATKFAEEWECHPDLNYHSEYGKIHRSYCAGAKEGFALAMEEAMSLVECLKVVGNYLYFMGDELTGDDFVGDGALTKRYNEKLNLIEQALKEFKERSE